MKNIVIVAAALAFALTACTPGMGFQIQPTSVAQQTYKGTCAAALSSLVNYGLGQRPSLSSRWPTYKMSRFNGTEASLQSTYSTSFVTPQGGMNTTETTVSHTFTCTAQGDMITVKDTLRGVQGTQGANEVRRFLDSVSLPRG